MTKRLKKPNILMIMTDQFNPRFIGAYGESFPKTPHLDRLADNGVVFEDFYCNSPLCAPSRASLVSGRYASKIEVYDNGAEFRASIPTFLHHLRRNGYRTVCSGKMHFLGPDQLHGFEERLTTDIYPANFAWTPEWKIGLDTKDVADGIGETGVMNWSDQLDFDHEVHFRGLEAIRRFGQHGREQPFFLCVSYTHPHDPYLITPEYWDRYEDTDIPMPTVAAKPVEGMHLYNQWIQLRHGLIENPPSTEEVLRARRAYCGMASFIDDMVGEMIQELQKFGLEEDTIVIFTSDHGDMMGEHGMWFKRTLMEDSIRIPFIASWPKEWKPHRVSNPASLVDVFPTILELAKVEGYEELSPSLSGVSLAADLNGEQAIERTVISEYCADGTIRPAVAVRRGRYKYIHVAETPPLLFDLEADRHEEVNLADRPECRSLVDSLRELVPSEYQDGTLLESILANQEDRNTVQNSMVWGRYQAWDYQPFFDASKQYRRDLLKPCKEGELQQARESSREKS
jgi:choline-sulfatase